MNSERESSSQANTTIMPAHVAIIMDGNGRWAQSRGLSRGQGHIAGARSVRMVVEESRKRGIRYLTLFSFSTENWQRPASEVADLMKLFEHHLLHEQELMQRNQIRLRVIGDLARLPESTQRIIAQVTAATAHFTGMDLCLAVSYGGREEIVYAARKFAEDVSAGRARPEQLTGSLLRSYFYAPEVPDPELLIRTSDEARISNFLLWQLAYSELVISPVLWPDFSIEEYARCLEEFGCRERRFGLTQEQIDASGTPA